jgi:hypothetical protein
MALALADGLQRPLAVLRVAFAGWVSDSDGRDDLRRVMHTRLAGCKPLLLTRSGSRLLA